MFNPDIIDKVYEVGGCVRDKYLGIHEQDIDYVVENITQSELELALPEAKLIGKDFPVYMYNGYEIALARTERKIGNGYTGFETTVGVSLLDDLKRRDFTINSMAKSLVTGEIIDPFNGVQDIKNKKLRAANLEAFIEDPLRIYRGIRFAARFGFVFEYNTWNLMFDNVSELKYITPDRVYIELKKVYEQCDNPSIFFLYLYGLNALKYHFKPLDVMTRIRAGSFEYHGNNSAFDHTMEAIDRCKANGYSFSIFLAVLYHDTGKGITPKVPEGERQKHIGHEKWSYAINKQVVEQNRFTAHQNELVLLFARQHMVFHILHEFKNYVRLVRWFIKIKRHWVNLAKCADCDHPLTDIQKLILTNLDYVFTHTVIDVPKHLKGESVINFVEHTYAKAYARMVNNAN